MDKGMIAPGIVLFVVAGAEAKRSEQDQTNLSAGFPPLTRQMKTRRKMSAPLHGHFVF